MCGLPLPGAGPAPAGAATATDGAAATTAAGTTPGAAQRIALTVNGKAYEFDVQPQETLVELLRERLHFMRTKEGCGVGECGSCTVLMDKKAVASCLVLAVDADGSEILTTEGMSCDSEFHPMQESFVDHLALQARIGVSSLSVRREYLTFCHLCCGHCAVRVTVADNVIVDMAPDLESGLSNEQCVYKKGRLSIPEIHDHPDRLLHPLKRVGARGEGKWEQISWEEALDTIADKFRGIREESGPEYVMFGLGEPHGLEFAFAQRFASAFGTPNVTTPGWFCGVPFQTANAFTFGQGAVPDEEHTPELLVVWGVNPNHTSGGIRRQTVIKIAESGAKIVVVDPRKIDMAGIADLWIKPRPATDGALALGLLKVLVDEGLYDQDFVRDWTLGFEELRAELATFTLADVARVTWVPEDQIVALARMIGTSKPACLHWGNGIDQGVQPFQTHRAISILAAISGNLNVPGGIVLPDSETNFVRPGKFYMLSKRLPIAGKTIGKEFPMTLKSTSVPSWTLVRAILENEPYAPRAAFFMLTNPMTSFVDSRRTREAFERLEFIVALDLFMTPTAALADIVLPVAFGMEHDEVGYWPGWYNEVRAHPKVVDPPGDARPDTWIINELARRLELPDFWEEEHEALDAWLAPSGLTFEDLKHERTLLPTKNYGNANLRTPSGKVEIVAASLAELGLAVLPTWDELGAVPELGDDYPLVFTNSKSEIFIGTSYKGVPSLRAMRPEPIVQMNPGAAADLGLDDGDLVYIETKKGRIKQRLVFDPDLDPRVIFADFGWWFPEDPSGQLGWDWGNLNVLTSYDEPVDPAVGVMVLRGVPCRVYKA
jgi:anaerobic selenocysteine-containing dehydrogenase